MFEEFIDDCANDNTAGIEVELFGIISPDIDTFPPLLGGTPAGDVTLDGNIVPVALKYFKKWTVIPTLGKGSGESTGPIGSKSQMDKFEFEIRNTGPEAVGAAASLRSFCGVFAVAFNNGHTRVFGSPKSPALLETSAWDSGADSGDSNTIKITIRNSSGKDAPFYTGTLPVAP